MLRKIQNIICCFILIINIQSNNNVYYAKFKDYYYLNNLTKDQDNITFEDYNTMIYTNSFLFYQKKDSIIYKFDLNSKKEVKLEGYNKIEYDENNVYLRNEDDLLIIKNSIENQKDWKNKEFKNIKKFTDIGDYYILDKNIIRKSDFYNYKTFLNEELIISSDKKNLITNLNDKYTYLDSNFSNKFDLKNIKNLKYFIDNIFIVSEDNINYSIYFYNFNSNEKELIKNNIKIKYNLFKKLKKNLFIFESCLITINESNKIKIINFENYESIKHINDFYLELEKIEDNKKIKILYNFENKFYNKNKYFIQEFIQYKDNKNILKNVLAFEKDFKLGDNEVITESYQVFNTIFIYSTKNKSNFLISYDILDLKNKINNFNFEEKKIDFYLDIYKFIYFSDKILIYKEILEKIFTIENNLESFNLTSEYNDTLNFFRKNYELIDENDELEYKNKHLDEKIKKLNKKFDEISLKETRRIEDLKFNNDQINKNKEELNNKTKEYNTLLDLLNSYKFKFKIFMCLSIGLFVILFGLFIILFFFSKNTEVDNTEQELN